MSATDILTIGDLKAAIGALPDDTPIGISVYGHTWSSISERTTHGRVVVTVMRVPYGPDVDVAMIHQGKVPRRRGEF